MIKLLDYGKHYVLKLKEIFKKKNLIRLLSLALLKIILLQRLILFILIVKLNKNSLHLYYAIKILMILKSN
jgi:hypothetical protein